MLPLHLFFNYSVLFLSFASSCMSLSLLPRRRRVLRVAQPISRTRSLCHPEHRPSWIPESKEQRSILRLRLQSGSTVNDLTCPGPVRTLAPYPRLERSQKDSCSLRLHISLKCGPYPILLPGTRKYQSPPTSRIRVLGDYILLDSASRYLLLVLPKSTGHLRAEIGHFLIRCHFCFSQATVSLIFLLPETNHKTATPFFPLAT